MGYLPNYISRPPLSPTTPSWRAPERPHQDKEVLALFKKDATCRVPDPATPVFASPVFVVAMATGDFRLCFHSAASGKPSDKTSGRFPWPSGPGRFPRTSTTHISASQCIRRSASAYASCNGASLTVSNVALRPLHGASSVHRRDAAYPGVVPPSGVPTPRLHRRWAVASPHSPRRPAQHAHGHGSPGRPRTRPAREPSRPGAAFPVARCLGQPP